MRAAISLRGPVHVRGFAPSVSTTCVDKVKLGHAVTLMQIGLLALCGARELVDLRQDTVGFEGYASIAIGVIVALSLCRAAIRRIATHEAASQTAPGPRTDSPRPYWNSPGDPPSGVVLAFHSSERIGETSCRVRRIKSGEPS